MQLRLQLVCNENKTDSVICVNNLPPYTAILHRTSKYIWKRLKLFFGRCLKSSNDVALWLWDTKKVLRRLQNRTTPELAPAQAPSLKDSLLWLPFMFVNPYLIITLGSCVTPQVIIALVPLITLWSCGGVVIRVRAGATKGRHEGKAKELCFLKWTIAEKNGKWISEN